LDLELLSRLLESERDRERDHERDRRCLHSHKLRIRYVFQLVQSVHEYM
jgi:hypothetical protein